MTPPIGLRTSAIAVASTLALLASLTACGGGSGDAAQEDSATDKGFADQSVSEIQDQVANDMTKLQSARMKGEIPKNGEKIGIDLTLNTDGDCTGSLVIAGGTADMIVSDGAQYLKGDDALWEAILGSPKSAGRLTKLLGDKWALLPPAGGGVSSFCDLDTLLNEFDSFDTGDVSVKIGEQADIDGTSALELMSDDTTTSIWVATEAPHYIVQIGAAGDEGGTLNFSDFDVEVVAEPPPDDEVVDLSKL